MLKNVTSLQSLLDRLALLNPRLSAQENQLHELVTRCASKLSLTHTTPVDTLRERVVSMRERCVQATCTLDAHKHTCSQRRKKRDALDALLANVESGVQRVEGAVHPMGAGWVADSYADLGQEIKTVRVRFTCCNFTCFIVE